MKQVVQSVSHGELKIVDVPQPDPGPTEVLVATRRSLLSAGTERAVRELASANLLQKARARPDLVRQAIGKARRDGIRSAVGSVRSKLDQDMPLGYSAAGIAVCAGAAVGGIRPGMRVATASAGHGDYQLVPGLLTIPIPDGVTDEAAAFGAVAGVALQGLRQAEVALGGTVAVIGLGLVGQLTTRLALAAGLRVIGIDLRDWTAKLATHAGAIGLVEGDGVVDHVREATRGRGVDAVVITAATPSSAPVSRATQITRDRGRVVIVGDVGLDLDRRPFYEQELELRFARSYGPGRYDRSYEEWGVDYPIGHVRWTEGRNIEAYLDLVAGGRVDVNDLVTHVFAVEEAKAAYDALATDPRVLAVQLSYTAPAQVQAQVLAQRSSAPRAPRRATTTPRAGLIGAGNYARATFLPALKAAGWADHLVAVTSARGLSAQSLAQRHNIGAVTRTARDLLSRDDIEVVFILSSHDSHADLVVRALDAGKHVFVEKPLALSEDELTAVKDAYTRNDGQLFVGFNRRHSAATVAARNVLAAGSGPLSVTCRVNAGSLPGSHWYSDRRQGGRVLGEFCHFLDLVSWIVGAPPDRVHAVGAGRGETALEEEVAALLGYPDGSAASLTYSTGAHPGASKERLEIVGRGHTVLIDDFRRLEIDSHPVRRPHIDKGHHNQLLFLRDCLAGESSAEQHLNASFEATETALAVLEAIQRGG
jgi:predicted dehydrogenase/threonine dehydrogenase-like Zn-dependent dehydrogenase